MLTLRRSVEEHRIGTQSPEAAHVVRIRAAGGAQGPFTTVALRAKMRAIGGVVSEEKKPERIIKSDAEWQAQLTPEEFQVTRKAGTERAFTGRYWNTKVPGLYRCVCCGAELF